MTTTSASSGVNYDPATTATSLAAAYTSGQQTLLTAQTDSATASATALTNLQSALSTYQSGLSALSSQKSMLSQAATFSDASVGNASATFGASAGSYAFFVDSLATASQVSYAVGDTSADGGQLVVQQDNAPAFTVNLGAADLNGDGILSPKELAAAINAEPDNKSRVTASVVTVGAQAQLVLTSNTTGVAGQLTLDASGVTNTTLVSALTAPTELAAAKNAVIWFGAQGTGPGTGIRIEQASNTFEIIDHVSMTFTKAMGATDKPVVLNVGADKEATRARVQAFVDNFNTLKGVIDKLTYPGNPGKKLSAGGLSNDSGVHALKARLIDALHTKQAGMTETLVSYGVTSARDGTLALDASKLTRGLDNNPAGLDKVIGSSSAADSVVGKLSKLLGAWNGSASKAPLAQRKAASAKLQASLVERQSKLDDQYNSAYQRYLGQFTKLQSLQSQMASSSSLFDAMFSTSKN